jgi:hypothetical protein
MRKRLTILERLPGVVARQGAHACTHHLARGQDNFHATVKGEVLPVRRVSGTALEGVTNDGAPTWSLGQHIVGNASGVLSSSSPRSGLSIHRF